MKKLLIIVTMFSGFCSYAQDTVKVATQLTPEQQAEADYNSGLERLKNNDYVTAIDFFTKSIANKPSFDKALYNRSIALTQAKRYAEALADINNVIKLTPQNPDAYFTKSPLLERAQDDVNVEGVFELIGADTSSSRLRVLKCAGLDVRVDGNPYRLHHKVFIIDDQTVVFGSFNFSNSAAGTNDENLLIVSDPDLAAQFVAEYNRVKLRATAPQIACR